MQDSTVLALIPAWNEGPRLRPVIEATREQLPVLVVDDGSEDDTVSIAEEVGANVVRLEQHSGKGVALKRGFCWALNQHYQAVLTLDADGQHDPRDIPRFISARDSGDWDLIIGRRDFSRMPFPRGYTNPFGSWLLSKALGERIDDNQSGYRLHDRELLEALNLQATGFEMEVEVIVQAVCLGMHIGWVDIRTIYGIDKTSYFHPVRDSALFLAMVWKAWRTRRSCNPA